MVKDCPRCGLTRPLSDFTPDKTKASGYKSYCKPCEAGRCRAYYSRTSGEKAAERYRRNREIRTTQIRAWAVANPEKVREYGRRADGRRQRGGGNRIRYMKRHGGIDEWARMFAAQGGLCYLCGEPMDEAQQKFIHVDHDHDCCPTGQNTQSCPACRRGLAHAWCNQIVGLCGEDMDVLRAIIANFEPVQRVTKERIAIRQVEQPTLMDA